MVVVVGLAVIAPVVVVVVDGGGDLSADVTGDESHLNLVQNQAFTSLKMEVIRGPRARRRAPGVVVAVVAVASAVAVVLVASSIPLRAVVVTVVVV